jgi:hypothetical protein
MNKKLTTADRQNGSYRSPEVTVAEISNEGVLCASGQLEKWEDGNNFTWDQQ